MLLKCYTQYVSKFGKFNNGHRTGKGQFSFQFQRRTMPTMFKLPYICTHFTCQQSYAPNPSSQASAVHELRTSRCTNWVQKRQRNQRSNCQCLLDHRESKGIPEKISASLTMLKSLTMQIETNYGKFLKRWEQQTTLSVT